MLFDRHRPRLRMDVDQRYAAYAHRTRERTRDAHERSASNINASVTRTACDTVSGADTHAAVPTLNTLHACPFARHAHNGTHGLRILQRTGIRVPFTLGGRPLRNALAHPFAHDGAGPERTFTRRRKRQRKTFTRGDKMRIENTVLQDRLAPVLGAMCDQFYRINMVVISVVSRLLTSALRIDQDLGAHFGNVIDQITENMANCIRGRQNRSPL